ncbi:ABC transporter substrate-binding protein [Streptomyces sp. NPDC092952]|uniref:ABC transporter substrate-binding protein n=1 Tax=Streptomyces sp. NPDC092952 TaxID=3366018 RepID=UPI0037F443CC
MRSIRARILAVIAVLVIAGVVAWQLLPSDEVNSDPVGVGTTDEVTSLDPAGAYDAGSWALYSNIYQSLLTFKSGAVVPQPDAAESCQFIGQKLQTYQCKLRDDLTFSNGRKITAEDVKFSIERMIKIKTDVGPWVLFPSLKNVVADGLTVTFNLTARDATFPQKLATGAGSIVDRESYPADKLREGTTVEGSGPFLLKAYRAGQIAELVPNPRYKGALNKTGVPVTVHYYKTPDDLESAWKAKQVEVTHRELPPTTLAELNPGDPDLRVTEADSAEIRNMVFNVRPGSPLADKKVRQAIAATVDRGPLVSKVYKGTVEPLYSLIPQGYIGHSTPFFDAYPAPDPARAKKLLQEAGVQLPVTIEFGYRGGSEAYDKETQELRRQLEADGLFKLNIHSVDWQKFQKGYASGKFDAYTVGWLPDYPDPDTFSQPLVGADNSLHNGYSSKKVNALIADTLQYSDRGRTSADFKEIQAQVGEDVPLLPLWQKKDYVVSTKDVSGSQYLSDGTGIWRLWELKHI